MEDKTSVIGSALDGSDIFDNNLDEIKPSIQPGSHFVYLSIPHPEWEHLLGNDFSKDIRGEITGKESKEWRFSLQSSESEVNLNWNLENVPSELELDIDVNNDGFFDDMRKISEITIVGNTSLKLKSGVQFWEYPMI